MLKFRNSNLNKLISSLDDLKSSNKKTSGTQAKAYRNLDDWASECNNSAINDVTSKLTTLYANLDATLNEEKNDSLQKVTEMFTKFKEYDMKVEKYDQNMKNADKLEKKCKIDIQKCPASKSIRDYEVRHEKAKDDLKFAEFKSKRVKEEIDATKSILFKTEFKRMNECFIRQNEAERVLLTAMSNLLEKIPDVSNEEVDHIEQIKYTKQAETNRICTRASKKLSRLSTTRIKIQTQSPLKSAGTVQTNEQQPLPQKQGNTKFKRIKSLAKILGPTSKKVLEEPAECKNDYRLYPCLDNLKLHAPPTYSDSESIYSGRKIVKRTVVVPSAPMDVNKSIYAENKVELFNEQEIARIEAANNVVGN